MSSLGVGVGIGNLSPRLCVTISPLCFLGAQWKHCQKEIILQWYGQRDLKGSVHGFSLICGWVGFCLKPLGWCIIWSFRYGKNYLQSAVLLISVVTQRASKMTFLFNAWTHALLHWRLQLSSNKFCVRALFCSVSVLFFWTSRADRLLARIGNLYQGCRARQPLLPTPELQTPELFKWAHQPMFPPWSKANVFLTLGKMRTDCQPGVLKYSLIDLITWIVTHIYSLAQRSCRHRHTNNEILKKQRSHV